MAVTIQYRTAHNNFYDSEQEALIADALEEDYSVYSYQIKDVVKTLTDKFYFSPKVRELTKEEQAIFHRRRKEDAFPEVIEPLIIPELTKEAEDLSSILEERKR